MNTSFGPWATAMHVASNPQLSTFWKRRVIMLCPTSKTSSRLSAATVCWLLALAVSACALPTLRNAPLLAEEEQASAAVREVRQKNGNAESKLREQWKDLDDQQAGEITRRHVHGLMRAAHKYYEQHGSLPPAVVPNPELPPQKRLSGLVLLLPHFDVTYYIKPAEVETWDGAFSDEVTKLAKEAYESIDQTKAWDDPVNLKAARTVIPGFLAPQNGPFRDQRGFAVSHFALVRGAAGKDNGAFPEEGGVTFETGPRMIEDGTVVTFGLGQIHSELGPWIAAGPSTSRYVYHPSDEAKAPTFGSRYEGACYFARCDSSTFFLDMNKTPVKLLHNYADRADGAILTDARRRDLALYPTAAQWKAAAEQE